MMQPTIFGGQTGLTYDQIQKQRDIANELLRANMSTPQNVGEGLSAIGRALAAKAIDKRTTRADEANKAAYETKRADIFGSISSGLGGASASPVSYAQPAPVSAGDAVANDTMSVLGNFGGLEQQYGLPQGYLDRTYMIESGGNPNAQNPNSSAGGGFQFIDSTAKQYGLTDKTDLGASAAAAARLAADNKAMLVQALGREPTAGELYLAHQQGGAGAAKLLANPNARAVDIVGPQAVTLNGGDPNMTASEFAGKWVQKFGGGAPSAQPAQGQGQPPVNPAILMQLAEIQGNPYASESDKAIASMLMGQVQQSMDPMRQMEMERARLELEALKNPQKKPLEVGGVLLDPDTMQPIFDSRQAQGPAAVVNVGTDSAPGLGKLSTDFGYVLDPATGQPVIDPATGLPKAAPVPGSPAAMDAAKVATTADVKAGNAAIASDTLTSAATRAMEAADNRAFGAFGQGLVADWVPSSDAAEVQRQVDVLKSQAIVGNLQAMRNASPTGGALGAVTAPELELLANQAGALDPSSPNFKRDVEDYTKTLLRTIHGPEVGTKLFDEWKGGGGDGWTVIDGVRVREKK